jgi:tRNA pseudouridine55 synthase
MDGALLVDKPAGPTSHDIVALVRRALHTPRVGHTGTLDPLATGLLVLLVGQATRCAQFLVADAKEYLADIRLGEATATYDAQGLGSDKGQTRVRPAADPCLTPGDLERVMDEFRGTFMQMPPPFSAKKVEGIPAYKKARKNEPIELKPVAVTVRELEVLRNLESDPALLRLRIVCTAGFYVRSLAHDIGQRLGCGAHLEALRRTRAGRFSVADALSLAEVDAQGTMSQTRLVPLNTLLSHMPEVALTGEGIRRVSHGNSLAPEHITGAPLDMAGHSQVRLVDAAGTLIAVAEPRPVGLLHPVIVLR